MLGQILTALIVGLISLPIWPRATVQLRLLPSAVEKIGSEETRYPHSSEKGKTDFRVNINRMAGQRSNFVGGGAKKYS